MTDQLDMTAMVKPLVWEKHPVGYMASTGQGFSYIVDDRNFRPTFMKWPSGGFSPDIKSIVEAKVVAHADHTARILASLDQDALARMLADAEKRGMERAAEIVISRVWKCAGCGIEGPDTMRRCGCATNVVFCGRESAWKKDPPCPHCGKPLDPSAI